MHKESGRGERGLFRWGTREHPWPGPLSLWTLQLLPTFGIDRPSFRLSLSPPFLTSPIATCLRFLPSSPRRTRLSSSSPRYESYFSPPPFPSPSSIVSVDRGRSVRLAAPIEERQQNRKLPLAGQSFFPLSSPLLSSPFPKQLLPPSFHPSSSDLLPSFSRRKSSTQPNDLSQIPRRRQTSPPRRTHKEREGERKRGGGVRLTHNILKRSDLRRVNFGDEMNARI